MERKEEFKKFVRTKPNLISYVNNGNMTWQKFYEMWNLYGDDVSVWSDYETKNISTEETKNSITFGEILNTIKRIDMNSVKEGINGLQKALAIIQEFTKKDDDTPNNYEARPVYKKFED